MVSIAFTGGGTGGHIYPGLAVASRITGLIPCRIFWIGSDSGMDRAVIGKAGLDFFGIPSGKLRRYFSFRNFLDIFRICAGFFAARKILKKEKPALLFSKGGFVSVPPCAAAKSLGIPVYSHESDYSPGLATRINAAFAEKIFIPYEESAGFYSGRAAGKIRVSGNPIRPEFSEADPAKGRAFLGIGDDDRILLALGGSLGSTEINDLVMASLPELTKHYTVVHQTGERMMDSETLALVEKRCGAGRYKPYAFFGGEIPHIIAAAELVLCRSGAGTIWECKSLKKPMVLVPLRAAGTSRGDQVENARLFEKAGAALCFMPGEGGASMPREALAGLVASLAEDRGKREAMGNAGIGMSGEKMASGAAVYIAEEIAGRIGRGNEQHSGH